MLNFNKAPSPVTKVAGDGRAAQLLLSGSFLLTIVLWFFAFTDGDTSGVLEYALCGILSVVLAMFTYQFVAIGVAILLIPVKLVVNIAKTLVNMVLGR